jgi:uncharacterized phage-associated protein
LNKIKNAFIVFYLFYEERGMKEKSKKETLKTIFDESPETKKIREKIRKQLELENGKLTAEALKKKAQEISDWIERHSKDRISLQKEKKLFDQNRNSAKPSWKVEKLASDLADSLKKVEEK